MRSVRQLFALGLVALTAACAADRSTGTLAPADASRLTTGSTLVECSNEVSQQTSALVGPLGGTLAIGNTRVVVPLGAVLVPTELTLTIPVSQYVEIDVTAGGAEHYTFEKPISVTIDYARCTRNDIDKTPLSIWYIDGATKALLEHMGGVDDKTARTVTFTTPHLSGYAVAD